MKFITNAFREIRHVVWPTPKETRTYMNYTIVIIVLMTIFLSSLGYIFRTGLQTIKNAVNPNPIVTDVTTETSQAAAEQAEYEKFGITPEVTTENTTAETSDVPVSTGETIQENSETTATETSETITLPSELEEQNQ